MSLLFIFLFLCSFDVENPMDYTGQFSNMEAVGNFLSKSRIQFWGELNGENSQIFSAAGKPMLVAFLSEQLAKNPDAILGPLKPIAKKFIGTFTYVWVKRFLPWTPDACVCVCVSSLFFE